MPSLERSIIPFLLIVASAAANAASSSAVVISLGGEDAVDSARAEQSCAPVPIRVTACASIRYNSTASFVNQDRVARQLDGLDKLVNTQCAPYLRLLACSVHLPFCNRDQSLLVRPCREFCQSVRRLCQARLSQYGSDWPEHLDCELLEKENVGSRRNLCLRPSNEEFNALVDQLNQHMPQLPPSNHIGASGTDRWGNASANIDIAASGASAVPGRGKADGSASHGQKCSLAELPVGGGGGGWCAKRCLSSYLFAKEDRDFAGAWMLAWSVAAVVYSGLALATFAIDVGRFRYPERPVVWVSACHLVHAGGHLLRAALGPELACSRSASMAAGPGVANELVLVSRHAGQWCAAIFLLLYFSWLAGLLWWLALALCWHLSAARRWHHRLLAERTVWLHLLAWGAPLLLSVTLLVLQRIEGDELTHLCVVDGSRPADLLMFQVVPMATALLLGLGFLLSALRSVLAHPGAPHFPSDELSQQQHRSTMQQPEEKTSAAAQAGDPTAVGCSSEQRAARLSLFAFLFALPAACVLAANIYELAERSRWAHSLDSVLARPGCATRDGVSGAAGCRLSAKPSAAVYMLKIFMSLTAGLPASLLVWANSQSLTVWRTWLSRRLTRKSGKQLPPSLPPRAVPLQQQQSPQPPPPPLQPPPPLPSPPSSLSYNQQRQHYHRHQAQQQQQQRHYDLYNAYATVDSVRCDTVRGGRRQQVFAASDV